MRGEDEGEEHEGEECVRNILTLDTRNITQRPSMSCISYFYSLYTFYIVYITDLSSGSNGTSVKKTIVSFMVYFVYCIA